MCVLLLSHPPSTTVVSEGHYSSVVLAAFFIVADLGLCRDLSAGEVMLEAVWGATDSYLRWFGIPTAVLST